MPGAMPRQEGTMNIQEKKRVLVVDDDDHVRRALEGALSNAGYAASAAASGREALELLHAEPFDLMLVDDSLYDMRLEDVLQSLRSHEIQPLIVVMQTLPRMGAAARFTALGASEVVGRWSSCRDIIEAVHNCFEFCALETTHA
jgi:DNA-binding NtrC family response regulator